MTLRSIDGGRSGDACTRAVEHMHALLDLDREAHAEPAEQLGRLRQQLLRVERLRHELVDAVLDAVLTWEAADGR